MLLWVRARGPTHAHGRIVSPPIRAPCYFGIDMKERKELVAHNRSEEEIAGVVGADSVHYLSIDGLVESIGLRSEDLCLGCLTGRYPVEVPEERHRFQKALTEF